MSPILKRTSAGVIEAETDFANQPTERLPMYARYSLEVLVTNEEDLLFSFYNVSLPHLRLLAVSERGLQPKAELQEGYG
jgi:hypothetical protein